MSEQIITSLEEGAFEITLNNPAKLNCMGFEMLHALRESIDDAEKNKAVKVIVFRGAGDRAFSTGANLKEFTSLDNKGNAEWIRLGHDIFNEIEKLSKPTIAFVNGYAMGGGLELALACDFRIGTASTIFCSAEMQNGWLPGWGGMVRLKRLLGLAKTKELVLLSPKVDAQEALKLGLITEIDDETNSSLKSMVTQLKGLNSNMVEMAKTVFRDDSWSTGESDIQFDIEAALIAKNLHSE